MKQWSLSWLRLQTFFSEMTSSQFVPQKFIENETEISSYVKPYFSAFNLSVRDFWSTIGLPILSNESLQLLEERKTFFNLSLKVSLTLKSDLPSICDHVNKMSKALANNIDSIAQICENFPQQEINHVTEDSTVIASPIDILKLQFGLTAAWNAYLKNLSVSHGIGKAGQLSSSVLFPLEVINWLRNVNKSEAIWSTGTTFEFQALSIQQQIVIQHIFRSLVLEARKAIDVPMNVEESDEKKDDDSSELRSLTQLMRQIAAGKRDFLDVEISIIDERRRQLLALQTQLVADCRDVVEYEKSIKKARAETVISHLASTLHGIDLLESPFFCEGIPKDSNSLISYAKSLKTKVEGSKFFPKHLQAIIVEVLTIVTEQYHQSGNLAVLQLCSGLLLLHISSELGFVDISEHLTASAEAIESEITSMTWVMIAEDTCNALAKVDEPLPVRPSQSDRRQLIGNHVKNQVTTILSV